MNRNLGESRRVPARLRILGPSRWLWLFYLPGLALAKIKEPSLDPTPAPPAPPAKQSQGPRVTWSQPLLVGALHALNARQVPLTEAYVLRKLSTEDLEALRLVVESPVTGQKLFVAATYHFGSWEAALAAAGIEKPAKRARLIANADLVVKMLRKLDDLCVPLNNNYVRHDPYGRIGRVLDAHFGPGKVHSGNLLAAGVHFFGKWDLALGAAGLDPRAIKIKHKLDNVLIRRAIRALYDDGVALNKRAMESDYSALSQEIIESVIRRAVSPSALLQSAVKLFGSWNLALANAGIDPLSVHQRIPARKLIGVGTANGVGSLTNDEIVRALAALRRRKIPLHQALARNDLSDRSRRLIQRTIGRNLPAAVLYQRARENFGRWTAARAASAIVTCDAPLSGD